VSPRTAYIFIGLKFQPCLVMHKNRTMGNHQHVATWNNLMLRVAGSLLLWFALVANAAGAPTDDAQALHAKYASLTQRLEQNQFNRPLVLDSNEGQDELKGDIYAVMGFPFAEMEAALSDPTQWCEVMILHLNTKYCRAGMERHDPVLQVNIGAKTPQALADSERIVFKFSVVAATPDFFETALAAQRGPLSTSNYRITLRGVPLPGGKTFIHLAYSYATGFMGRVAMQGYLATVGRGKVGFTVIDKGSDGEIKYIGGVRGVIERNTMRYFLAIDSYMGAVTQPKDAQFDHRLHAWFAASEQYARQLHELRWDQYAPMKHAEHARMLTEP